MSSLIVLLPPTPLEATGELSYLLSPDGRSLGEHGSAPLGALPLPRGGAAEVVAIVPARSLSWHQVTLPKGTTARSPRLRQVLEGLLEDRLLDEPEALHFALAPHAGTGEAWVAVCDRAWLRQAVQALEAAHRPAARLVPEFVPQDLPTLHVVGEPEAPQLVSCGPQGVLVLPLAASSLALVPPLPEGAAAAAEPAVAALAEQVLQHKADLQQAGERWLQAAQGPWDLAQFEFASSGQARARKRLAKAWSGLLTAPQWRPARWAAVLLVAANLAGLNAWAWKERSELQAKQEQVRATLTRTFPQVKVVVDAPVQMEREIALLRASTGVASGRDLEAMLAAVAAAAPPGRTAAAIEFSPGELRVRGLAGGPEDAQAIAAALKGQGYAASLQGDALVVTPEASQ